MPFFSCVNWCFLSASFSPLVFVIFNQTPFALANTLRYYGKVLFFFFSRFPHFFFPPLFRETPFFLSSPKTTAPGIYSPQLTFFSSAHFGYSRSPPASFFSFVFPQLVVFFFLHATVPGRPVCPRLRSNPSIGPPTPFLGLVLLNGLRNLFLFSFRPHLASVQLFFIWGVGHLPSSFHQLQFFLLRARVCLLSFPFPISFLIFSM